MDQKQKLDLLRLHETNPSMAFIKGMDILFSTVSKRIDDEIKSIGKKLPEMALPSFVERIRGEKGPPVDENKIIDKMKEFFKNYVPKDGHSPSARELVDIIEPLIPEPIVGHSPTKAELIALIKPLMPKAKDGLTPTKRELLDLIMPIFDRLKSSWTPDEKQILSIVKPHIDAIKTDDAKAIVEKINSLSGAISQKSVAGLENLIKNINRAVREKGSGNGKMIHGGGDTVKQGNNILLVRNSDGTTTISATGGGSGSNFMAEVLTGTQSGNNVIVTATKTIVTFLGAFKNGQKMVASVGYTISGENITFLNSDAVNDYFELLYTY